MKHKPALYALIRLHGELAGKISDNKREANRLRSEMKNVEATIKLLEPGYDVRRIAVRRRYNPNPIFKKGTVFREVLSLLRTAPEPMTAEEIALALYRSKGVTAASRDDRRRMYGTVATALRVNAGKTVTAHEGRPRRWSLNLTDVGPNEYEIPLKS
jgi:hypothetical protein